MTREANPAEPRAGAGAHTTYEISDQAKNACAELRQAAIAVRQPMPPEPLCEELLEAVRSAATQSAESMKMLHAAVCRFTLALKNDGVKPEAILIALKTIINTQVFPVIVSPSRDKHADRLRELISTWCIEAMFSGDANVPRVTERTTITDSSP